MEGHGITVHVFGVEVDGVNEGVINEGLRVSLCVVLRVSAMCPLWLSAAAPCSPSTD